LDLVRLWTGLACWFCAAPGYDSVKTARQELTQAVTHQRRAAGLARVGGWIMAPFAWAARALYVFDNAVTWIGGNVLIASGGITLLALFVIERRIIMLLLT
jgi:cytochrome c biogenesis protein CcdA